MGSVKLGEVHEDLLLYCNILFSAQPIILYEACSKNLTVCNSVSHVMSTIYFVAFQDGKSGSPPCFPALGTFLLLEYVFISISFIYVVLLLLF